MKFSVNRELLCEAVTNLTRAVSTKTTFPVLEGIHMTATGDGLKMMAYNLESIGMTKTIDINCVTEGTIVLKAKKLGEMLRIMSGDVVNFEVNDRMVCKISCGSTHYDVIGMPPEDFPQLPVMEDENESVKFPYGILKDMVRQTAFATATAEMNKQILTGLLFDIDEDNVKVVGVDGIRLAMRKQNIRLGKKMSFVISAKTIAEVVKIVSDDDTDIEFYVGRRHIAMMVDGYTIISRKLEGEFIDYRKVMPTSFSTSVKVNTKDILSKIEPISLIINDQLKTPMRCKICSDRILFSGATAEGRGDDFYLTEVTGEEFEIGINNRFLTESLKACETDDVIMNFNGPFASIIILPAEGDDFIYMVMPTRLKAE